MARARAEHHEARIAGLVARGDLREAAAEIFRDHGPLIRSYLCALLRDGEDAKEAFSRFAEDLCRGIASYRGDAPVRAWALRVAQHAAIRHLRDPYRRLGRRLEAGDLVPDSSHGAAERSEQRRRALVSLRAALDPSEQALLALRADRGLHFAEIAALLSTAAAPLDEAAVRKRFERLKAKLTRLAREAGLAG